MPYCYYCGSEIYLVLPYYKIRDCYCEKCQGNFSALPKGQVSQKEMDRAQRDFQKDYFENMGPGMPYKEVVNRMLAQKTYSGKMHHPKYRNREPWSTLVAKHDPERRLGDVKT